MKGLLIIFALGLMAVGCSRQMPSEKPPIHLVQNMDDQAKVKPQSESGFYADGLAMRPPVEGTVARGMLRLDSSFFFTGKDNNGRLVEKSPLVTTMELLDRGRGRFNIFCAPCHGRVGNGVSTVVKRGMLAPPSFHEQRLRDTADGHFFDVMTNGVRNMPPYKYQIPAEDRWAIIAYIRALQRSQNASEKDLPADVSAARQ